MRVLRHLLRVSIAAVLVSAITLLVVTRPPLPIAAAPGSAPRIDALLIFIAWLGGLLLALGLLYRISSRGGVGPRSAKTFRHVHAKLAATPRAMAAYPDRAFPLILKPRESPLDSRDAEPATELAHPSTVRAASEADGSPPAEADPCPTISLLGPLTISGGRKHIRRLRGPTKELLAYLALHPAGAQREQIIDALWRDQSPERGRRRLWRAAGDARSHFGEAILARDGEHYQLDRTRIAIDLDQLEQLLTQLEQAERPHDQVPVLKRALALFRGEALTGSDYPWAEHEQRRLHAVRLALLDRAGRACLALADPAGALGNAEAGLAVEPYNEHLARLAMEAEAALGLRSAVIDRYQQLRHTLQQQLGLEPHSETKRLYRRLLAQEDPKLAARGWGS